MIRSHHALCLLAFSCLSFAVGGCGSSTDSPGQASSPANAQAATDQSLAQTRAADGSLPTLPTAEPTSSELADALFDSTPDAAPVMSSIVSPANSPSPNLQLRSDLSPTRLVEFLKLADLEMQNIASGKAGIFDQAKASDEMVRVGKLKLQAATQLRNDTSANTSEEILGVRGQLQSLSHLAALGDLKSAEDLETLATEQVQSQDAAVAEDSRLVLIGLALERVQNGSAKDAGEVIKQVREIGRGTATPSIAAMMVMGQARAVLEKYGFTQDAGVVRNRIVDLFASHPDPNVASMAMEIAGTPRFTDLDRLMRQLEGGEVVAVNDWRMAVDALIADSPDLSAVQFLASTALQNEAAGRVDLVASTYAALTESKRLGEREQREVALAIAAFRARESLIGKPLKLDLFSSDGRPLSLESYRGKVILMPFWSIEFSDSLSNLQLLDEIRQRSGDTVEIIGVNLDSADAPVEEFLLKSPVPFRSFVSITNPGAAVANETAQRLGVVAMPFVIVVDPQGNVAAVDFTGQKLSAVVRSLITPPKP